MGGKGHIFCETGGEGIDNVNFEIEKLKIAGSETEARQENPWWTEHPKMKNNEGTKNLATPRHPCTDGGNATTNA